jgi:hypothetical protein
VSTETHIPTLDERADTFHEQAFALLSTESYEAIEAAAGRLLGLTLKACIRRALAAPWRPSTKLPDGALIRVALDLLGVKHEPAYDA